MLLSLSEGAVSGAVLFDRCLLCAGLYGCEVVIRFVLNYQFAHCPRKKLKHFRHGKNCLRTLLLTYAFSFLYGSIGSLFIIINSNSNILCFRCFHPNKHTYIGYTDVILLCISPISLRISFVLLNSTMFNLT